MHRGPAQRWHALTIPEVVAELETSLPSGLSRDEAARRRQSTGPNTLPERRGPGWPALLLRQFRSVLVLVLVIATVLAVAIGELLDAVAIAAILLLNAVLGFVQEYRAERTLAALNRISVGKCAAIRDGRPETVAQTDLVPGDLIELDAGNAVPADGRLVSGAGLTVSEASLTGESTPVRKELEPVAAETPLADRMSMVYRGTLVTSGRGRAVVTATGGDTELGHVAELVGGVGSERSPLEIGLDRTARRLTVLALAAAVVVFVATVAGGADASDAFLTGVALAVAAVPEGLPAAVTIVLALGVRRMAARHAIVRRLAAVETLGSTDVICADKTGTLTLNELAVRESWQPSVSAEQAPLRLAAALAVGADAAREAIDPTDFALLAFGAGEGVDARGQWVLAHDGGFDVATMCSSVVRRAPGGGRTAYVKGAPESVLDASSGLAVGDEGVEPLTPQTRSEIEDVLAGMARRGLRPIGLARRRLADDPAAEPGMDDNLEFIGLVGMIDPLRLEAVDAVRSAREAGVRTVMITGDHPSTAAAIARDAGIGSGDVALTGREVHAMERAELREASSRVDVYARVTSEDKLRIVEALKDAGSIVAMTGDGVNDAPALREAHVGVAMGMRGTDAAREAAELVLTDDNYASIVAAIEEGRVIVANIQRFLLYLLSGNAAEVVVVALTALAGTVALLPVQILWVNLITDGLPALALGVEPQHEDTMHRPPRPASTNMLGLTVLPRMAVSLLLIVAPVLVAFAIGMRTSDEEARNLAFATLVTAHVLTALTFRSTTVPLHRLGLLGNPLLVGAVLGTLVLQAAVFYLPPMHALLSTSPLSLEELAIVGGLSAPALLVPEIVKTVAPRAFRSV